MSGSRDNTIRFWNLTDNKESGSLPIQTFKDDNQLTIYLRSLCLISDNTFAAGSRSDINIYAFTQPNDRTQPIDITFRKKVNGSHKTCLHITSNR